MEEKILCTKGKGHFNELIGGEILFGLTALTMLLCAILIPLEESVTYISYIFYALFVLFGVMTSCIVASHVKFSRMPEVYLKLTDPEYVTDLVNGQKIYIRDIREVTVKHNKNKYGREYNFGTIIIRSEYGKITLKNAENLRETKEILELLSRNQDEPKTND